MCTVSSCQSHDFCETSLEAFVRQENWDLQLMERALPICTGTSDLGIQCRCKFLNKYVATCEHGVLSTLHDFVMTI